MPRLLFQIQAQLKPENRESSKMLFERKRGLAATFGILLNERFEPNKSLGRLQTVSHLARARGDTNINLHNFTFSLPAHGPEKKRMTARGRQLEVSDETPAREPTGR